MRAVAREEKATILHRLHDKAAHRRNALLQHFALCEFASPAEPSVQFIPNPVVRPMLNLLIVIAL